MFAPELPASARRTTTGGAQGTLLGRAILLLVLAVSLVGCVASSDVAKDVGPLDGGPPAASQDIPPPLSVPVDEAPLLEAMQAGREGPSDGSEPLEVQAHAEVVATPLSSTTESAQAQETSSIVSSVSLQAESEAENPLLDNVVAPPLDQKERSGDQGEPDLEPPVAISDYHPSEVEATEKGDIENMPVRDQTADLPRHADVAPTAHTRVDDTSAALLGRSTEEGEQGGARDPTVGSVLPAAFAALLRPPKSRAQLSSNYYSTMEAMYVEQNLTLAVERAKAGAAEGHGRLHWLLGVLYANGVGVPQSDARAVLHYTFAALDGIPEAHLALGFRHKNGISLDRSCDSAIGHYREAADAVAMTYNGMINPAFPATRRLPGDSTSAADSATQAAPSDNDIVQFHIFQADGGNMASKITLGYAYMRGDHGLQRNWYKARDYFVSVLKDAKLGPSAYGALGQLHATGSPYEKPPIPRDLQKAAYYFQQGAKELDPISLNGLGYLHTLGLDDVTAEPPGGDEGEVLRPDPPIRRNFELAFSYFSKSSKLLNAEGTYNLGVLFLHGRGVPQNVDEALVLFRKAAMVGSVLAHWQLGRMQYYGIGAQAQSCELALRSFQHVVRYGSWYQREYIGSLMLKEEAMDSEGLAPDGMAMDRDDGASSGGFGDSARRRVFSQVPPEPSDMTRFVDYLILAETGHTTSGWNAAYMLENSAADFVEDIIDSDDSDADDDDEDGCYEGEEGCPEVSPPQRSWLKRLLPGWLSSAPTREERKRARELRTVVEGADGITRHSDRPLLARKRLRLEWQVTLSDRAALRSSAGKLLLWLQGSANGPASSGAEHDSAVVRANSGNDGDALSAVRWLMLPQRDSRQLLLLRLLTLSAVEGDAESNLRLGNFYYYGKSRRFGVDMQRARAYYEIAAMQRNAQALFNVGTMHQLGLGTAEVEVRVARNEEGTESSDDEWLRQLLLSKAARSWNLEAGGGDARGESMGESGSLPAGGIADDRHVMEALHTDTDRSNSSPLAPRRRRPQARSIWGMMWHFLHNPPVVSTQDLHMAKRYYDETLEVKRDAKVVVHLALLSLNFQWWLQYYASVPNGWLGFSVAGELRAMASVFHENYVLQSVMFAASCFSLVVLLIGRPYFLAWWG